MNLDNKRLKILLDMIETVFGKQLTIEDVHKMIKMENLEDCKQYMKVILDFYFDVIMSPYSQKASSHIESDRNLWVQTIFSKGCHFLSLLEGVRYFKGSRHLNPIIDFSTLFTIARNIYESLIAFEILFALPKTEDQQTIIYNLFMAHGLSERLKDLDERMLKRNPQRVKEEQDNINECKKEIETTKLYKELSKQTKNIIDNAFGKKFRYVFNDDNTINIVKYEEAYKLLNVKEDLFNNLYSFFSLHGHPSYLALCQFREAFKNEYRADIDLAKYATQCVLSFMSIFIFDYMKLNPSVKGVYDKLEEPRRFAIGMYEDSMRGENKFH